MNHRQKLVAAVNDIRRALSVIETFGDPPHMKGYAFEREFTSECRKRGFRVVRRTGGHVDMCVCGKRVQCKCVTPNQSGQVFIQPGQRTWYEPSDFDVLAMKSDESLYIIPVEHLPKTNGHIRIQIKPASFRRFIDAWGVFTGEGFTAEPSLFDNEDGAL